MKRNISIFVSTMGVGGAEKQAAILARLLSSHFKVHFVVLYGEVEPSSSVLEILNIPSIDLHLLKGSWLERMKYYWRLLKTNHVETSFNYLTMCDFAGAIVERFAGVKAIYNGIRNTKLELYKTVLEWVTHSFIATGTIINCYSGKEDFEKRFFNKRKMIVIPNCFLDIHEPFRRNDKSLKKIITVGRFHPQKDLRTAIEAISLLKQNRNDFKFIIVGYGLLEQQIRDWVKQYRIDDLTEIHINPPFIPKLLEESDVYLSTSLFEGTSNSIMEALNYSLPIVATNVGDNSYLVHEGSSGFLHPVGDASGMSLSLMNLLSDYEMRINFGVNGNIILKGGYSEKSFVSQYLQLLGS